MPFDDWLPGNALRQSAAFWRSVLPQMAEPAAAGMSQIADLYGFSPAGTVRELLRLVESKLRGHRLELVVGDAEVELTVQELAGDAPPLGPTIGQFGTVQVVASEVSWGTGHLSQLTVQLRNLHVQPGDPAVLVSAPIEIEATIDQDDLDTLLRGHPSRVGVEVVGGEVLAFLVGREGLGHVAVDVAAEGSNLVLRPRSATLGRGTSLPLPGRFLPSARVDVSTIVADVQLVDVEVADTTVVVRGLVPERHVPVSASGLDGLARRLRNFTGGRLVVPPTD